MSLSKYRLNRLQIYLESRDVYVCGFGALGLGADDIHVNRFHKMEFFDVVKANGDAVKKVIAGPNYAVAITG